MPTRKNDNDEERQVRVDAILERHEGLFARANEAIARAKIARERALRAIADTKEIRTRVSRVNAIGPPPLRGPRCKLPDMRKDDEARIRRLKALCADAARLQESAARLSKDLSQQLALVERGWNVVQSPVKRRRKGVKHR